MGTALGRRRDVGVPGLGFSYAAAGPIVSGDVQLIGFDIDPGRVSAGQHPRRVDLVGVLKNAGPLRDNVSYLQVR